MIRDSCVGHAAQGASRHGCAVAPLRLAASLPRHLRRCNPGGGRRRRRRQEGGGGQADGGLGKGRRGDAVLSDGRQVHAGAAEAPLPVLRSDRVRGREQEDGQGARPGRERGGARVRRLLRAARARRPSLHRKAGRKAAVRVRDRAAAGGQGAGQLGQHGPTVRGHGHRARLGGLACARAADRASADGNPGHTGGRGEAAVGDARL
mmetsp:Transcript_39262/g.127037  ORF Transcript_39262/g.127037 Transcript_39262/m.127037 type:complete len:206 (+) Transcript_39262:393-1010(+)